MEWIPCTERLPEKSGRYLVTRGSNVSGSLWNKVDILNYSDLMGLKKEKIWWSGNVGKIDFEKCDHVIAWMPLPEPYEESENKENDSNESLEQQRVGKWIINKEYNGYETIIKDCKCPFCNEKALLKKSYSMDGQSIVLYPSNYCPNCGAKMWNILTRKHQKSKAMFFKKTSKSELTKREEEIRDYIVNEYGEALYAVEVDGTPETRAREDEASKILGKIIDILGYKGENMSDE